MYWEVACAKDIGGRGEQQDHVEAFVSADADYGLIALADGMGGHRGGALASRTVVQAAQAQWSQQQGSPQNPGAWDGPRFLTQIVDDAHARIVSLGQQHRLDPHTTCVLLLVEPTRTSWLHVGDSRCYRVRAGEILSRTRDHSVVQLLVDLKEVDETEMGTHPDQNRLLRSLGGGMAPEPEIDTALASEDDGFVLCSDGLWETVSPAELAKALGAKKLQQAADDLVALAAARGGETGDNISVALVRAMHGSAPTGDGDGGSAGSAMIHRLKRLLR